MASYKKLFAYIKKKENNKFLLVAHERPDGDTIAAVLAMSKLLQLLGKKTTAISHDRIPKVFQFLADWQEIKDDFLIADYEVVILLDNGDLKRTGYLDRILLAKSCGIPIINIDHHPKNDIWKIAKVNIVNEKVSSTCEIIYDIYQELKVKIDKDTATALLTGIYTDTGGFQHANTAPTTLGIISDLLSKGARLKLISDNISNYRSVAMLKLWGVVLDRIEYRSDLKLVYSVITRKDMKKCGAKEEDLAGVVNLISSIPGEQATLLLYELPDGKIKGSLRTESSGIDVSKIAEIFGGGGHKKASGFVIEGKLEKTKGGWKVI